MFHKSRNESAGSVILDSPAKMFVNVPIKIQRPIRDFFLRGFII